MKHYWIMAVLLGLGLGIFGLGCSEDENPVVNNGPAESSTVQLDAADAAQFVYYNLVNEQVVTEGDAGDWHIAFRRVDAKLKEGLRGVDLQAVGDENGMNFDGVSAGTMNNISEDDWFVNSSRFVVDGWYGYNRDDHSTPATGRLFAMQTNSGGYAKFVIDDPIIPAGQGLLGSLVLRYVYDPAGTDLSGQAISIELTADDNAVFFSFDNGQLPTIADPSSSTEWDLWFDGYTAKVNSGASGPGSCGVYPIYDETNDFDALLEAPPNMGGSYEMDSNTNVFTGWYDYNGNTHEITSKGHVYIIEIDDSTHFKMEITNYYKVVDGSPVSGWISLKYSRL